MDGLADIEGISRKYSERTKEPLEKSLQLVINSFERQNKIARNTYGYSLESDEYVKIIEERIRTELGLSDKFMG